VVAVHRLKPIGGGIGWYEGLRVDSGHRRQGIGRALVEAAIEQARRQGWSEIRLATASPPAVRIFEQVGFRRLARVRRWSAGRVEGGDPAHIPGEAEAPSLAARVAADPGSALYGGLNANGTGARDLDAGELGRLARAGRLRVTAGGRALAAIRPPWGDRLSVSFISGSGAALKDLLLALRFEADADGLASVGAMVPPDHPAEADLESVGYDVARDAFQMEFFGLRVAG
jgi:hypothetical protein